MNNLRNSIQPSKNLFRHLALAATITVFCLIVLGGIVRVTGSGGACLDWPTCFGAWTPPAGQNAVLDYTHRAFTALAIILVLASAISARRARSPENKNVWSIWVALALLAIQVGLGARLALNPAEENGAWISALHLGLSLLVEASLLVATVGAYYESWRKGHPHPTPAIFQEGVNTAKSSLPAKGEAMVRVSYRSPFARLSLVTLLAVFFLLVSGAVVAGSQSTSACLGWPLCDGIFPPPHPADWLHLIHRSIVILTGILVIALFVRVWRTQRTQTAVITATTAAAVLFFAQALLGSKLASGFPPYLIGLHQATAVSVWAALVVQVVAVGLSARSAEDERLEAETIRGRKGLFKDLLLLTKPIVVALLLVTTFAGMVIGAQAWPSLPAAFWTLLGGFMAAGGSGAINQYIDRYDDEKMQRTQKRPIPSGRLTAGEGLAFGVGLALASFYLFTALVNFLAALLTLAGIIYYVLIYSIFLKKTTVQNIVIGGGAGAIPPLVGWAAATGSLNIPALFLFAIVFMWTPPHFWALALVRRKDYARAGVPMLPVVRGENETRWQIFLYTLELVALSLALPLFGLGRGIYLVGAAILGLWLLSAAYQVWKQGGNKLAWKMYRYSSMYLAFLFVALMVDRLVK